ncbi:hypothetical protein [Gloeothece verrucosa]|uniref:hypothetical protein n=1 Tax=Gloeothece verrucosa TaxID=2546359 RepID=UPI00017E30B4|nr:hypothetical protein [Gloeothece verrucosa]
MAEAQIAANGDIHLAAHQHTIQQILSQQSNLDVPALLKMIDDLGFKLSVTPKNHL